MLKRLFGLHPRIETLSRFAEDELTASRSRRVKRHLESCGRCRRTVSRIREAERLLAEILVPSAPPEILERVLARREDNTRTILPDGPVVRDRRRVPAVPMIGAIAAALAAFVFAVAIVPRASADSSALIIGEADTWRLLPVRYVPASYLAGEEVVRARARVWFSGFEREPTVVNQILRRNGGEFEGVIELPSDAAYARIAVENLDGDRIDLNYGRFWEVRDRELPLREVSSFAAEFRALTELLETGFVTYGDLRALSIEMTEAHPESPRIWEYRRLVEFEGDSDPDHRAEALAVHRRRVAAWADAARRLPFAESHLEDMLEYAHNVGDPRAERIIAERLERLNPGSAALSRWRTLDALEGVTDPAERLAIVADEWARIGADNLALALVGFYAARDLGDVELIDRWSDRLYLSDPSAWRTIIRELSEVPGLERKVSRWAREQLEMLADTDPMGPARPLHQPVGEFALQQDLERGRLLGYLAAAQLRLGVVGEGLEAAEVSLRRVWDAEMAARLLSELETTDRSESRLASELRVRLIADPLFDGPLRRGQVEPAPEDLERARAQLASTIVAGARLGRTPSRLIVPTDRPDAAAPTLLFAFRRAPGEDATRVREITAAAATVRASGGRTAAIAPVRDRDRLSRIAARADLEELADPDALLDEFGIWHAWDYIVVDGERYSVHHHLEEAVRLTLLLAGGTLETRGPP